MKLSEQSRVSLGRTDKTDPPRSEGRPPLRLGDVSWTREELGILKVLGDPLVDLSDPQYDSRKVKPGSTFFAIKGFQTDGHRYIAQAIEQGASAIVMEDADQLIEEPHVQSNVTQIVVEDGRRALAFMSEAAFGYPSKHIRLIGVTGTNGKTTVTHLIKQLLTPQELVGIIGTIGIGLGEKKIEATHTTPESRDISECLADMVAENARSCVMEVSSHALSLERVSALQFSIAVFTNLTQDHLDFHETMDAYFSAKQLLFNQLTETSVAITNANNAYGEKIVSQTVANAHSYGIETLSDTPSLVEADLIATNVQLTLTGSSFTVRKRYSEERADFSIPLIGRFNIENTLAAIGALYFGIEGYSLERLSKLCRNLKPVRGRFESISLSNGAVAIIDYAHTPDALENVLTTILLIRESKENKIITVFGCGGDRDKTKRPEMGRIAERLSDRIVITTDNARSEEPQAIADDVIRGLAKKSDLDIILDRRLAIEHAFNLTKAGDIILLAGKGHETYQIIGNNKTHFDDREEILRVSESSREKR